jgi:hydrogenase-4 component E
VQPYIELPLIEQVILTLAAMILASSLALLAQSRVVATIRLFAWQGVLLAIVTALVALVTGELHLLISALLTLSLKAMFIPWLLIRQARILNILKETDAIFRPGLILLMGGALVVFCYSIVQPVELLATSVTRHAVALSLAVVMLSMLMLITRRKAVTQVVAFMAIENGLFFAAVTTTQGMPLVVELGIAFDVMVAAVIFGVFFFHMRDSIGSLDTDKLVRLSEYLE